MQRQKKDFLRRRRIVMKRKVLMIFRTIMIMIAMIAKTDDIRIFGADVVTSCG